jgi:hypothetical protein
MISDFPIAPPIRVKDSPRSAGWRPWDARSFAHDALAARRTPPWRELHARLKEVKSEDDAIEAIGALRELLMMEGLLQSDRSHG